MSYLRDMFVDRVRIWAKAGDGGDGCCSFRREKFIEKGGPDGGDGGKGGDVILRVSPHRNNLFHLRDHPHHFAMKGCHGSGKQRTGKSGKDIVIEVPPGTCVYKLPTTDENFERAADIESKVLAADLTQPDEVFCICEGGKGGAGNMHFKSSVNQAPRKFKPGEPGEKGQFILELKSIADVGLVGFPNAGKSSLLGALSSAKPKVAPYPFTTLHPVIGVIELHDYQRITMADIPGLIEGAHEGVGLGHDFLRHIERCKLLVFMLDMAGVDNRHPASDYVQLRKEINLHDPELSKRPFLVVGNKMDLPEAEQNFKEFESQFDVKVFPMSTKSEKDVLEFKEFLFSKIPPYSGE